MDLGKAFRIGKLALGTAAYPAVPRRAKPAYARWLRREVEHSGCMYVKIGQWVSSRTDLFPQEVTDEFAALRTSSAPMPLECLERIVGDLQQPFDHFDPCPVSSGSIAQVHTATLQGRKVAVKVQRPGLLQNLQRDLGLIKAVMRPLQMSNVKMYDDLVSSLDDLLETVNKELDFLAEAEHMRRFRDFFSESDSVLIPEVIDATPHAIIMQYLPSKPFSGDASRLMELFFVQFFQFGWLHTDMHSGNMGLGPGDALVLYDFGSVLQISEDIRLCIKHLMVSYLNKNTSIMVDYMLEFGMLIGNPPPDERQMLEDFVSNILEYVEITDMSRFTSKMKEISSPRGAPTTVFKPEIFMIMRSFTLLEGLCKELDPNFIILDAVAPLTQYFVNDPAMLRLKIEDDIRNALYTFTRKRD